MSSMFPQFGAGGLPYADPGAAGGGGGGLPMFGAGTPGSNQFVPNNPATMPMPGNTSMSTPGPSGPGSVGPTQSPTPAPTSGSSATYPGQSASYGLGGGNATVPTFDPQFTQQFFAWLQSQLGKGATPFNLSTLLPSGRTTAPGQLNAPLNPIDASLMNFYETGQGGPMAGVLPMWNADIAAMNGPQGPVAQEMANLKGQFAFAGDLSSSPMAQAMTQFGEQTVLNENALLTQATQAALPTMAAFGGDIQTLDQNAINNMLQEFIRTQPEYSPLLNMMFGGATSSPGVIKKGSGMGALGGILSGAGGLLSGLGDIGVSIP